MTNEFLTNIARGGSTYRRKSKQFNLISFTMRAACHKYQTQHSQNSIFFLDFISRPIKIFN